MSKKTEKSPAEIAVERAFSACPEFCATGLEDAMGDLLRKSAREIRGESFFVTDAALALAVLRLKEVTWASTGGMCEEQLSRWGMREGRILGVLRETPSARVGARR